MKRWLLTPTDRLTALAKACGFVALGGTLTALAAGQVLLGVIGLLGCLALLYGTMP